MLQNLDFEPIKPYNLREYANVRIPFININNDTKKERS